MKRLLATNPLGGQAEAEVGQTSGLATRAAEYWASSTKTEMTLFGEKTTITECQPKFKGDGFGDE
jgi:hypothetical protein